MNSNIAELVTRYRGRGAVVDTNLFLVLLLGNVDPRLIGNTARTDGYSAADYDLLREVLEQFARIVILPQILTEAGNLLKRNCRYPNTLLDLHDELARIIHFAQTKESSVSAKRATLHPAYHALGYADAAILAAANGRYLLLTADGPLQNMAWSSGVDVLPFDWLKHS
ncbi:MAG: hypothetical protein J0M04_17425 [Verrucomicrobia bacterium]|nr:hypothetical protein [Verrucomicrobiota bacterium]